MAESVCSCPFMPYCIKMPKAFQGGVACMNMSLVGRAARSVNAPVQQLAHQLLEHDGRYAHAFENLILALIVLSLVSVGLETLSGLPAWATLVLKIGEIVIVAVFSFEYLLRIVAAPRKFAFIFSFYGLVDLL